MDGVVTMLQQYKRILVAVDGSDESEAAFRKAVHVANRNQSSLFLLHVIDTMSFQSVSGYEGLITENVTDQVKETLEEYKKYDKNLHKTDKNAVKFSELKVPL